MGQNSHTTIKKNNNRRSLALPWIKAYYKEVLIKICRIQVKKDQQNNRSNKNFKNKPRELSKETVNDQV